MELQFERTKLDDNFDEARAILKANGVTLEMAMAKLLELRALEHEKMSKAAAGEDQAEELKENNNELKIQRHAGPG